jgi:hypothetical protein
MSDANTTLSTAILQKYQFITIKNANATRLSCIEHRALSLQCTLPFSHSPNRFLSGHRRPLEQHRSRPACYILPSVIRFAVLCFVDRRGRMVVISLHFLFCIVRERLNIVASRSVRTLGRNRRQRECPRWIDQPANLFGRASLYTVLLYAVVCPFPSYPTHRSLGLPDLVVCPVLRLLPVSLRRLQNSERHEQFPWAAARCSTPMPIPSLAVLSV